MGSQTNFAAMKRTTTIILSLILVLPLQAQMTLNDCLIYAREHSHSNRMNRLEVEVAAADKRISVADMLPYIGFGSNGSLSFGRNIDPETNTYDNKKTLGTGFGVELSLPLFDGLVRINNTKALKTAELRKKQTQLVEEDRISLEVIKNFYNVSYCQAMVEQMIRQLSRDSTDLIATERGETLGTKSGADVAEMKAIVAADLYELANQRNLLKKANLALRSAMGMSLADEPLQLIDTPSFDTVQTISEIPSGQELPDIKEAELSVRENRHYLNAAKGGYSPRLSFSAGVSTSYYRMMGMGTEGFSFARQFRNNMGEYISFSLSIPLFDGLATANRVKRAKINLHESETRLEQTRYKIEQATQEARLDRNAAIEELSAAAQRLEAEQIAYKAIRRKFELGMASAIDLYTSGAKLATAEANLVGKRIQRIIADITFRYYQGYPLIEQ